MKLGTIATRLRHAGRIVRDIESMKINQGIALSLAFEDRVFDDISDAEFKIFSQWGEDGIIQYIVNNIKGIPKTFVEFGVEDFSEANCRFLMMKDYWQGLVIDGSKKNIDTIKSSYWFWRYPLQATQAFIDRDNIAELIDQAGFDEIGLLSIDIDGVDWYVLEALSELRPAILICEYNGLFGPTAAVTVPYDPAFVRSRAHHSNIYYGASIRALAVQVDRMGYAVVAGNKAGNNVFFVRRDLLNDNIREITAERAFRPTAFREARDAQGMLTFPGRDERRALVASLPLIDVVTGERITVGDLPLDPA